MKLVSSIDLSEPSLNDNHFKDRLNSDLDYLGFSYQTQSGILFFMGASLNMNINQTSLDVREYFTESAFEKNFKIVSNLYSSSTGNFEDYGELNDYHFSKVIYSANYVLNKYLMKNDFEIDSQLRSISKDIIIGKTEIDDEYTSKYKGLAYNLENIHMFCDDFFHLLGINLKQNDFSLEKSYEAGIAYANMMLSMDLKGTWFLFNSILSNLSPIFSSIIQYPILQAFMSKAFSTNHIFSATLQGLLGGLQSNFPVSYIYRFHQFLFYEPGTSNFRNIWDFNTSEPEYIIDSVFVNSLSFRSTDVINKRGEFLEFNQLFTPDLKHSSISKGKLFNVMLQTVHDKYGYHAYNKDWLNNADFMLFCVCLFYETSLHVMLPESLTE
jgi:hypothetical protein